MQIYVPNNLSRDQILGSLINDATFVFGDIINQDQGAYHNRKIYSIFRGTISGTKSFIKTFLSFLNIIQIQMNKTNQQSLCSDIRKITTRN